MSLPSFQPPQPALAGYELVQAVASGGMATLYLARREGAAGFSRNVAIKVVHPHLAKDETFVRMFLDEARLSSKIQHPNVVHVEQLGEADGVYFMVMEYVSGCSLSAFQRELAKFRKKLTPAVAVHLVATVAAGLHAAHTTADDEGPLGIVHRDVSPQNVLLSYSGHVKLIDFGIAKTRGASNTTSGGLRGKLRYMSPEQAWAKKLDARSDVFSLAVVLWELLTMRRLVTARNDLVILDQVRNPKIESVRELAPDVPEALAEVVANGLATDRDERYESAWEFRAALFDALPAARAVEAPDLGRLLSVIMRDEIAKARAELPSLFAKDLPDNPSVQIEIVEDVTRSIPKWVAGGFEDDGGGGEREEELSSGPRDRQREEEPKRPSLPTRAAHPIGETPSASSIEAQVAPPRRTPVLVWLATVALVAGLAIGGTFLVMRSPSVPAEPLETVATPEESGDEGADVVAVEEAAPESEPLDEPTPEENPREEPDPVEVAVEDDASETSAAAERRAERQRERRRLRREQAAALERERGPVSATSGGFPLVDIDD